MNVKREVQPISKAGEVASVQDVCDYIIVRMNEAGFLNVLKLHKLLYYVQAWRLALENKRCFESRFQAWVHGPVNREIYDRFKDTKSMYSRVRLTDVREDFDPKSLPVEIRRHIRSVLEVYGDFADDQLEEMTHQERPWREARDGYSPRERCEVLIRETTMRDYYAARLKE